MIVDSDVLIIWYAGILIVRKEQDQQESLYRHSQEGFTNNKARSNQRYSLKPFQQGNLEYMEHTRYEGRASAVMMSRATSIGERKHEDRRITCNGNVLTRFLSKIFVNEDPMPVFETC